VKRHKDSKDNQVSRIDQFANSEYVVTTSFVTVVIAPGGVIPQDLLGQSVSVTYFAASMEGDMSEAVAAKNMTVVTSSNEKLNSTLHGRVHVHHDSCAGALQSGKLSAVGGKFVVAGNTPAILSFNITFVGPSVRSNHIKLCELLQAPPKESVAAEGLYSLNELSPVCKSEKCSIEPLKGNYGFCKDHRNQEERKKRKPRGAGDVDAMRALANPGWRPHIPASYPSHLVREFK
jgi:hypothetical protein